MVVPWIWVPIPKTQVNWPSAEKKRFFSIFCCHFVKKFQMAANRTILILEPLPMAHMKAYVPNFPKHPWESRKSLKLRELCPSKVRWSRFVSLKIAVFSALFWRKSYFWPTSTKATHPMIGIFGKLCIWRFRKSGWNSIFDILWSVRFLGTGVDWILPSFLHCVLSISISIYIF